MRRCRELDFSGIVPRGHCILNVCMFQKMYFLTDYSPGTTVSCCVHLWLLLSYKMYSFFFCSLQASWCHGPWCFMLCTLVVDALLQNVLCMFSAGLLVSWGLVFHGTKELPVRLRNQTGPIHAPTAAPVHTTSHTTKSTTTTTTTPKPTIAPEVLITVHSLTK